MSVSSELSRLKRDLDSLAEEIAVNTGPRAKAPLSAGEKRSLKAEMQALIQRIDELAGKLSG
jgi:hypothetical protein